ncbi:MAG: hypothetical protein GQ582_10920 [Methyloprofundus sp.]|nr:hypothetical protein [Methyloprofundus sp.]
MEQIENTFEIENKAEIKPEIQIEDIPYHSDKEMLIGVALQFVAGLALVFGFDWIIEGLSMLLELMIEIFHLCVEIIEEIAESSLHNIMPESRQKNEAIIVNLTMFIIFLLLYKLFRRLKPIHHLMQLIKKIVLSVKKSILISWQFLPVISRIKLVSAYLFGFSLIFLFSF